jgi:hypothetical protein
LHILLASSSRTFTKGFRMTTIISNFISNMIMFFFIFFLSLCTYY